MPNLPTRVVLFLSSYTPLFLIMAVKYGSVHRYFGLSMVLLAVISIALLLFYLKQSSKLAVDHVVVEKIFRQRYGSHELHRYLPNPLLGYKTRQFQFRLTVSSVCCRRSPICSFESYLHKPDVEFDKI